MKSKHVNKIDRLNFQQTKIIFHFTNWPIDCNSIYRQKHEKKKKQIVNGKHPAVTCNLTDRCEAHASETNKRKKI